MTLPSVTFSHDQAEAFDRIAEALRADGVDLEDGTVRPPGSGKGQVLAVTGKAGSGKTLLLSAVSQAAQAAGVTLISGDYEPKKTQQRRTLAILAPTNKAASVLRLRGVPATTIHRILYTPVYDPEYERIAEWLAGEGERPAIEGLTDAALDRAYAFYQTNKSVPGRISSPGGSGATIRWTWG